jgi:hypothetical protein
LGFEEMKCLQKSKTSLKRKNQREYKRERGREGDNPKMYPKNDSVSVMEEVGFIGPKDRVWEDVTEEQECGVSVVATCLS